MTTSDCESGGGRALTDALGRPVKDLRISVTDRCNFRCVYCMPKHKFGKDYPFLGRKELLSFEEIVRVARLLAERGVAKLRLTGGEPLIRREIETLISGLVKLPGIRDLTLTTNGALLSRDKARTLCDAGLNRITISLDALDERVFQQMNDVSFPAEKVLDAVDTAMAAGLDPVKVNMVVRRGFNDQDVLPMVRRFRGTGAVLRFIEYMDVGNSNDWRMADVVPGAEIVQRISREYPLEPAAAEYSGEVASRWRFVDGTGEVGVVTSVTQPFCGGCTRLRLSAQGRLYACLFAQTGWDIKSLLRDQADDQTLGAFVDKVWRARDDRYSELRTARTGSRDKIEMSYIGG